MNTPIVVRHLQSCPIKQLKAYPLNARTHPAAQIQKIANSMREFGFVNPILAAPDYTIIAGHARFQAARQLGMAEVPVIVLEHLSETQRRALAIADNQLAENARWDEARLQSELAALEAAEFDLSVIGFDDEELTRLLAEVQEETLGDPDAAPEVPATAVSQPGDVWLLGEHRLLCGDATNKEAIEAVMRGKRPAMVFTDPPYGVAYTGKTPHQLTIANDDLGTRFHEFLQSACVRMLEVSQGAIYICMSSSELHTLFSAFTAAGGHWSTFLIWAKHHFTLGRSDYQRQYEPILYGCPVLGYDVDPGGGRLVVNEPEAERVRAIFALLEEKGSLALTLRELERRGWRLKSWNRREGGFRIGNPFTLTSLRRLLSNILYTGAVRHNGQTYPGEHPAILEPGVWERVQERIATDKVFPRGMMRNKHLALLNGLLYCECCAAPMVYSYATKNRRRYPYYVCRQAQRQGWASCPSKSLPAQAIEQSVLRQVREAGAGIVEADEWERMDRADQLAALQSVVERIVYDGAAQRISIRFHPAATSAEVPA